MKCPKLLLVCWCSSIFAATSCFRVDGYSCASTYWKAINCILNITGNPVGLSNTTYSLKFISTKKDNHNTTCPLVLKNNIYSCDCEVQKSDFLSFHKFSIQLCNGTSCHSLIRSFRPSQNIRLTPPENVEVQQTPKSFNITWSSEGEKHRYLKRKIEYELLLQKSQSSWSQTLKCSETSAAILRSNLDDDAEYCIGVRSKTSKDQTSYNGTWSTWSPMTCWKNGAQAEQDNLLVILTKSLAPVCVVIGVLLFVFSNPTARMKIKTLSHTPSPAPFFQTLFKQHEGNLQEWLSPQGQFPLTYKNEQLLMTNDVTVVPKPITEDPEEHEELLNSSVTPLTFSQCQTSYVGLPEMHEASHPITMSGCPRDTSYTQLPFSVWGFGTRETQVIPSPPQTFLDISHTDSGCSCEDLTQSLESSLPTSPVGENSPPCFCNDYCILNKTAEGVVPVLVSK